MGDGGAESWSLGPRCIQVWWLRGLQEAVYGCDWGGECVSVQDVAVPDGQRVGRVYRGSCAVSARGCEGAHADDDAAVCVWHGGWDLEDHEEGRSGRVEVFFVAVCKQSGSKADGGL